MCSQERLGALAGSGIYRFCLSCYLAKLEKVTAEESFYLHYALRLCIVHRVKVSAVAWRVSQLTSGSAAIVGFVISHHMRRNLSLA